MASTLVALQTVTVGAGGSASISFTSIPQTYTDLVIKVSARNTYASIGDDIGVTFNGVSTNRIGIILYGTGSAAASTSASTPAGTVTSNTATANTFGNTDIYISNYASSNYKSISSDNVTENNATGAYQTLWASLWSSTAAITSITLTPGAGSWMQYSTFTLYGVYNSASEASPSVPTIGTATDAGTGTDAYVAFTPGANTGAVYTAISSPGSITGSNNYSPILVSGLTTGTAYTFQVKAANPGGTSGLSSASNSITPLTPSYESIATVTVGAGGSTSIAFSSIPSTYSHLQIRSIAKDGSSGGVGWMLMRYNGSSTGSDYIYLGYLLGDGSTASTAIAVTSTYTYAGQIGGSTSTTFGAGIIDILDYANTNKFKTVRIQSSIDNNGSGSVIMTEGAYLQNTAISSLTITPANGSFAQYSTFALYGIK